jgi:hypothetical protein
MFCGSGRFRVGTFCSRDVLELGPFVLGRFVVGRFVGAPGYMNDLIKCPHSVECQTQ